MEKKEKKLFNKLKLRIENFYVNDDAEIPVREIKGDFIYIIREVFNIQQFKKRGRPLGSKNKFRQSLSN